MLNSKYFSISCRDSTWDPNPFKTNKLNDCNLTKEDYVDSNAWVGLGNDTCTDPKILREKITVGLEDMRIKKITIETFDQEAHLKYLNDSSLQWTQLLWNYETVCYTMSVPKNLGEKGIYKIIFDFDDYPELDAYIHQKGLLFTDMPDSSLRIIGVGAGYDVMVSHEVVHVKKYNKGMCLNDPNYMLDECRLEHIKKVTKSEIDFQTNE